jgi:hypothetical protein
LAHRRRHREYYDRARQPDCDANSCCGLHDERGWSLLAPFITASAADWFPEERVVMRKVVRIGNSASSFAVLSCEYFVTCPDSRFPMPKVTPAMAPQLSDVRLQLHHAAQFATGAGISYLPHRIDDSHTNLEWSDKLGALLSQPIGASTTFRVGVRAADLVLLVVDQAPQVIHELPLHGRTIAQATESLRTALASMGVDPARYTLQRHYTIPTHGVALGAPFNTSDANAFAELSAWFATGASALSALAGSTPGASDVRCWPHHFDIATLIVVSTVAGRSASTIGVGLEAGDAYYDEPYFYVNPRPQPNASGLPDSLAGGGTWHTHEWIGAVLPGSRVQNEESTQRDQIQQFLVSAVDTCRGLLAE